LKTVKKSSFGEKMRKLYYIVLVVIVGILTTAFQCSSTELTSAKLYIQQKNYDKALDVLQKEVAKNPQSDEGWYLLGTVQGEKKNYEEMIKAYDKSLSVSSKYAEQIDNSKKYFWANMFNDGVSQFKRGVGTQDKDSAKVFFDQSINSFEYAIQLQPDSADTYTNLAFVYMNAQRFDDAIVPLKKIIDLEKGLDGYKYLGEIYYNKGITLKEKYKQSNNTEDSLAAMQQFNEAINVLEEGRKVHPQDPELLVTLSNSYIAANKVDVAIDAFKAGVEQDPGNKYYRYNYGVLLLGSSRYADAEEQFLKAIEIDPEYQNAIYNLAVTYVRWGTQMNEQADQNDPNATAEYKKKYEAALPYLEKVVEMNATDPAMWELLGRVYTVLNMTDDANAAFKKADELR
jgi:tetratricopeptide (TPR) repeat protein